MFASTVYQQEQSVITPGSHCACGKSIPFYHNIPSFRGAGYEVGRTVVRLALVSAIHWWNC